jgi:hypothetical protein
VDATFTAELYFRDLYTAMVRAILELRSAGYRYKEIDGMLNLPKRSYRIINGRKARELERTCLQSLAR